jgi:hypothetical protein
MTRRRLSRTRSRKDDPKQQRFGVGVRSHFREIRWLELSWSPAPEGRLRIARRLSAGKSEAAKASKVAGDRAAKRAKMLDKAVALSKANPDISLTDLAEKVTGRERGTGLNYTRGLLQAAGVWKG